MPLSRVTLVTLASGTFKAEIRSPTTAPVVTASKNGFSEAVTTLVRTINELNQLSWAYGTQTTAFNRIAETGTAIVTQLQGMCNQATAQTDIEQQSAAFSESLWIQCRDFLKEFHIVVPEWYEPDVCKVPDDPEPFGTCEDVDGSCEDPVEDPCQGTGAFLESEYDPAARYSATVLMMLKNHISAFANAQSDCASQLMAALSMTQQTYNICCGVIKSMNDLLSQAIESIVRGG